GPDGNIWYANALGDEIGRITIAGVVTTFPLPAGSHSPLGIVAGPDGALWFTESLGPGIGRITTTGAITEFKGFTGDTPGGITAGPDNALWYAGNAKIGRITLSGQGSDLTPATSPFGSNPSFPCPLVTGPDGNIYYAATGSNEIGIVPISKVGLSVVRDGN